MLIVPYNHHDDAELSVGGSPAPSVSADSPLENTQNHIRGEVLRINDTGAVEILGTFADGLARPIDYVGIFRHRLHGANVRWRLYSAVNQGGSLLHDTGTVPVIWWTPPASGYDWGGSSGYDPLAVRQPFRRWLPSTYSVKSYQITLSNFAGVAAYWPTQDAWQLSRIFMGARMQPITGPAFGATFGLDSTSESVRSDGGSDRTSEGASWRVWTLDLNAIRDNEAKFWRDMADVIGLSRDFIVSVYDDDGTVEERDHHMNVKFSALDALGRQARVLTRRLQLKET